MIDVQTLTTAFLYLHSPSCQPLGVRPFFVLERQGSRRNPRPRW